MIATEDKIQAVKKLNFFHFFIPIETLIRKFCSILSVLYGTFFHYINIQSI